MARPPPMPRRFPYTTLFRSLCFFAEEERRVRVDEQQRAFVGGIRWGDGDAVRSGGLDVDLFVLARRARRRRVVAVERLRSEEHTSELQSLRHLVCRRLLEKK